MAASNDDPPDGLRRAANVVAQSSASSAILASMLSGLYSLGAWGLSADELVHSITGRSRSVRAPSDHPEEMRGIIRPALARTARPPEESPRIVGVDPGYDDRAVTLDLSRIETRTVQNALARAAATIQQEELDRALAEACIEPIVSNIEPSATNLPDVPAQEVQPMRRLRLRKSVELEGQERAYKAAYDQGFKEGMAFSEGLPKGTTAPHRSYPADVNSGYRIFVRYRFAIEMEYYSRMVHLRMRSCRVDSGIGYREAETERTYTLSFTYEVLQEEGAVITLLGSQLQRAILSAPFDTYTFIPALAAFLREQPPGSVLDTVRQWLHCDPRRHRLEQSVETLTSLVTPSR